MNIRDILERYKTDSRILALAQSLNASKNPRVQLRGLVGSSDAAIAVALYFLQHKHMVFVLPEREEAGYFQADLENLTEKRFYSSLHHTENHLNLPSPTAAMYLPAPKCLMN